MEDKLKTYENEAQIINNEDLAKHNNRGTYMRDDHCDWGSSGMQDLVETLKESTSLISIISFSQPNLERE